MILLNRLGGEVTINMREMVEVDLSGGFVIVEHPDPFRGTIVKLIGQE